MIIIFYDVTVYNMVKHLTANHMVAVQVPLCHRKVSFSPRSAVLGPYSKKIFASDVPL